MNTADTKSSWLKPVVVTAAFIAPALAYKGGAPSSAVLWLCSGTLNALAGMTLLVVIMGWTALKPYMKFTLRRIYAIPALCAALVLCALCITRAWRACMLPEPIGSVPPMGLSPWYTVPLILFFCLAVGYSEELLFRVYVITAIEERGGSTLAALMLSALSFAAAHGAQGGLAVISAAALGLILATFFIKKRSWHTIALAHAGYNMIVLFASFKAAAA